MRIYTIVFTVSIIPYFGGAVNTEITAEAKQSAIFCMLKQLCENRSREAVYNEVNNYPEGAVREAEKHKDIFREEPVKRKRRAERNKRERDESCEIHAEPDDAAKLAHGKGCVHGFTDIYYGDISEYPRARTRNSTRNRLVTASAMLTFTQ